MNSLLISGINELFSELVVHTRGGTIVFADEIQNECLSWNASIEGLMNNGAVTVMDLHNHSSWVKPETLQFLFDLKKNQKRIKITEEEAQSNNDFDDEFENWNDEEEEEKKEQAPKYKLEEVKERGASFTSSATKALFFVASLSPKNEQAIKKAVHTYTLDNVVVLCGQSDYYAQHYQTNMDQHYLTYSDLTERISFWCKEAQMIRHRESFNEDGFEPMVGVKHFLVNYATITPNTFTFPCLHDVFPYLTNPTDHSHHERQQSELPPPKTDLQYKCVAHALRDMFCLLELDAEVYSMGSASHSVAEHLMEVFKQESFSTSKNASLFLIDRTLDLATPTAHSENYFDRIQSQLERQEEYFVNVTTPTNPVIQSIMKNNGPHTSPLLTKQVQTLGTLHHMHGNLLEAIQSLTTNGPADTLRSLMKLVKPNVLPPSRITDKHYEKLIDANEQLTEEWQFAGCIRETTRDDQLSSMEKIIMMDASVNEESLLEKILFDLKKRSNEFELTHLIRLLIFVYSLTSSQCSFDHIKELKKQMVDMTMTIAQSNPWLTRDVEIQLENYFDSKNTIQTPKEQRDEDDDENWDTWDDDDDDQHDDAMLHSELKSKIEKRVHCIFDQLKKINRQRSNLKIFDKLISNLKTMDSHDPDLTSGLVSAETTYQSLVKQLLSQLDNASTSTQLSDIRHSTSLIKSFAKFTVGSLFGGGAKLAHSKPLVNSDTQVVIVFVVGGITGAEIRDAHQVMKRANGELKNKILLMGGTRFATPDFIMRKCF